jgi:hypothetical protein
MCRSLDSAGILETWHAISNTMVLEPVSNVKEASLPKEQMAALRVLQRLRSHRCDLLFI